MSRVVGRSGLLGDLSEEEEGMVGSGDGSDSWQGTGAGT